MDQISGLMPQVGWSPLLMASAPKKAPATTVEPAATSSSAGGGLGANINTQTGATKGAQLQARAREVAAEATVLAQSRGAEQPDPDAPTGPPPTFDVTPLEAQVAELRRAPQKTDAADTTASAKASAPEAEAPDQAEEPTQMQEAPPATPQKAEWHASGAAPEPSVDVTR